MDAEPLGHADTVDGALDLVEPGEHLAGIARMTRGHTIGNDQARGRLRHNARFAAKLRRAIALPFDDGGHGRIVGIDDFTVAELLAGIRLRRDNGVSVRYAEELNSAKSSVILQRTDRHEILG